jgi:hypothetical protein
MIHFHHQSSLHFTFFNNSVIFFNKRQHTLYKHKTVHHFSVTVLYYRYISNCSVTICRKLRSYKCSQFKRERGGGGACVRACACVCVSGVACLAHFPKEWSVQLQISQALYPCGLGHQRWLLEHDYSPQCMPRQYNMRGVVQNYQQ